MDINKTAKIIYEALLDKKAENPVILNIGEVSVIADYFIIANGTNKSQINAMVDDVTEKLAKEGITFGKIEGINNTSWILMDYGDIIVHIFSKEDREFYDLERIWADCKKVEPESL